MAYTSAFVRARTTVPASSDSFVDPAPGATQGRIDQGVDWSNVKSIVAVASGKIVQVYQSLGGFGRTIIERLPSGTEIYYAEETGGGAPVVSAGESVRQGQQLAPGTGGVIEAGYWDPSTGRSAGAPGYREGQQTTAGQRFAQAVGVNKAPITRPGGDSSGDSGGGGPEQLAMNWRTLVNTPRTAPPGTKNPFKWFLASYTDNWDNLYSTDGGGNSVPSNLPSGGKQYGQVSYDMVQSIGQSKGWTQAEIDDWFYHLIPSESNGTLTDKNPKSDAYGIAQGITGPRWYTQYGGNASTVQGQLIAMANYIEQRYQNPTAAWVFHQKNNWY